MTTSQDIKRARDVREGTFVRVLDDVPNSELTIGDEGIVVDRPEGKFLLTEELDEPLSLSSVTPLQIISPVREPSRAPTITPEGVPAPTSLPVQPRAPEFEEPTPINGPRQPLTEEEEAEFEQLLEMEENGDEMEPEEEDRFRSLGQRLRAFGRAAGAAARGAGELGLAVGRPAAIGITREIGRLREPEVRRRIREGLITGVRETGGFLAERAEVPLAAAELGLRGVARAETATARLIRQLTGQQVRLSRVPAGASVRFDQDLPEQDIFRGDEGVVQFGIRRRQRRVFFPSTGETVLADPNTLVTVIGRRTLGDQERRQVGRRLLERPEQRRELEERFFAPRRPTGVPPAPETFRPRIRQRPSVEEEFIEPPPTQEDRFRVLLGF